MSGFPEFPMCEDVLIANPIISTELKKCRKCGNTEFYKNNKCVSCSKKYSAAWSLANPDKQKEMNNKWRLNNIEKIKLNSKIRYDKNPDKYRKMSNNWRSLNKNKSKETSKKWHINNPESKKESDKRYRKKHFDKCKNITDKWRKNNPEKIKSYSNKWRISNPIKVRARACVRRSRQRNADGSFTEKDIKLLMKKQKNKCVACNKNISKSYHIDHIFPLALGGNNKISNIQLLCPTCNVKKGAKNPIDFMQSMGFLL
jgi:predicted RNA-binding Zn-ribbon protein involved in translation (DUF1610 family)